MMVPPGGKLCRVFPASVYIRAAAEPLSKQLKEAPVLTFVPTLTFQEWEEKHLRGNIRSLITSVGPRLGALIKRLPILIMGSCCVY